MKRIKISLPLLSMLIIFMLFLYSSFIPKEIAEVKAPDPAENKSCVGIKVNNKWLSDPFDSKARAMVDIDHSGKLTVTDAPNEGQGPFTTVAFKIYIKKNEFFISTPVPEYANKSVLEVDLETVLKHCKLGDQIIIEVTEAGKYAPVFQNITVGEGC